MRGVILYNPKSGRGTGGEALARQIARAIGPVVGEPVLLEASAKLNGQLLAALSTRATTVTATATATLETEPECVLICVGGDGTVHHALRDAMAAGTPVWLLPQGTENLFAREFGMRGGIDGLVAALRGGRVVEVDVGLTRPVRDGLPGPDRHFAVMASLGPDASVIHRLAAVRRGPISHADYVMPSLAEAFQPALKPMTVEVDGRVVVGALRGLLVVANSRQYAVRIDPAANASVRDGLLDVVFLPADSTPRVLLWALQARLRRLEKDRAAVIARGRRIVVHAPGVPSQLDGEAHLPDAGTLEFALAGRRLRVLTPGDAA